LNNYKDQIEKANRLKKDGKFEEALNILRTLNESKPNSIEIKPLLIKTLFDYGDHLNDEWVCNYEKAVDVFKEIIILDPNNYRAWYNLGISYSHLNKIEDALNAYTRSLKLKPDYMYCYYNIGLLFEIHKEDLETALSYYEKALSYNRNFTYALQASRDVRQKLELLKISESDNNLSELKTIFICKKCGNPNRVRAKFCDKCGEPI
jgi:tetratricopeptide (TPR) repeat protein